MRCRTLCVLGLGAGLAAACSAAPTAVPPPDPRGVYTLVSLDAQPVPLPLPAQWDTGQSTCIAGEESEKQLTGGVLEIRELGQFGLNLTMVEFCTPPSGPSRDYPFSALVQGHHSLENDTLRFFVPLPTTPLSLALLYSAPYHPQILRLSGEGAVLEFVRAGS